MPVLDVNDPKILNFLVESYEKESRLRMKWVQLHAGDIEKAALLTREAKNYTTEDIAKSLMEAGMAATTRDHINAARHKYTAPVPDYLHAKVGATKDSEAPMKPVAREVKDSLREGRLEYLKKRSSLKPEDKYSFAESTNWLYGWKLDESVLRMSGPVHGKVNHVVRALSGRVGPQRDPDHYNSPDDGETLCVTI